MLDRYVYCLIQAVEKTWLTNIHQSKVTAAAPFNLAGKGALIRNLQICKLILKEAQVSRDGFRLRAPRHTLDPYVLSE